MVEPVNFKIGVISDTHDYLDPKIPGIFAGVNHILHAGDIGLPWIILDLEAIAPVTAVLGNNDLGLDFKETELITLANLKFLIHHIVEPRAPSEKVQSALRKHAPDVVVFGHSHKQFSSRIGSTLFFNPGYAGKPRFNQPRSVAILTCAPHGIESRFVDL